MAENILETFIESNLHPKYGEYREWPKTTIAVCLIEYSPDDIDNTNQIVTERNITGSHAEMRLLDCIKDGKDLTKIKSITIYINRSPCIECSGKIMAFMAELKQNDPDFKLQVKFTSFYNIQRPSCKEFGLCCKKDVPGTFRMLWELDAMPFQEKDWRDLINLLKKDDVQKENPTSDLDGLRYGAKYRIWRDWEDNQMMADYKILSKDLSLRTPDKNTSSADEPPRRSKSDQATGSTRDGNSKRKLVYPSEKK